MPTSTSWTPTLSVAVPDITTGSAVKTWAFAGTVTVVVGGVVSGPPPPSDEMSKYVIRSLNVSVT